MRGTLATLALVTLFFPGGLSGAEPPNRPPPPPDDGRLRYAQRTKVQGLREQNRDGPAGDLLERSVAASERTGVHGRIASVPGASRSKQDAAGPVSLMLGKTWNGEAWEIELTWSGHTGSTMVSYSTNFTFQERVWTLETGYTDSTLTIEGRDDRPVECFDVTDSTTVSRSVQSMGYDPRPEPVPVASTARADRQTDVWWRSQITSNFKYLETIPKANSLAIQNRVARADSVASVSNGYAQEATFTIPADARSFWMAPQVNGRTARRAVFHSLIVPDVGPYKNLRHIEWASQTGHVWVAADGRVDELDIFKVYPTVERTFTDATKPYLSRVTGDGRILYVDGVAGVTDVYQIDVSTGARTVYAATTDDNFDRSITPVGIAAAIDGSACYIADASGSVIVRIPEANATDITDDWGSWPYWNFPDPAGMETTPDGRVLVGSADNFVGEIPDQSNTWLAFYTSGIPYNLNLDRDVSSPTTYRVYWNDLRGVASAYNRNPIENLTGTPVRNLGALILNDGDDKLTVSPLWNYLPTVRNVIWPFRVVLNREDETEAYPWSGQVADRLVRIDVQGWYGVPLHLRLIDPPDIAPYAPDGGWPPKGGNVAFPPYEANDNEVWEENPPYTDFGLTTDPDGIILGGPVLELNVTPGTDHEATVYVKLPARYAGDNWRVEVTKRTWNGAAVPNKVPGFSSIFTGWKRAHVERERMFRRGGLLSTTAYPADSYIYLANFEVDGSWVQAHNLQVGDLIVIFDNERTADESYDQACVKSITPINQFEAQIELAWIEDCVTPHLLIGTYNSSVDPVTREWDFDELTRSAGVGVISECTTDLNVMHGNSCFFEGDMRRIEPSFSDANVEFYARPEGAGYVPYLPKEFFDAARTNTNDDKFSLLWFGNFIPDPGSTAVPPFQESHNYFHLIGASERTGAGGTTSLDYDNTFVFTGGIEAVGNPPAETVNWVRSTTNHEFGHHYEVNPDDCAWHDDQLAWCGLDSSLACFDEDCLMNVDRDRLNDIDRFCVRNLDSGAAAAGSNHCDGPSGGWDIEWQEGEGAIRTEPDPK
jgi:hypothetical protein